MELRYKPKPLVYNDFVTAMGLSTGNAMNPPAPGLVDLYFTSNDATDIRHSVKSGDVSSYLYLDEQRPDGNGGWTVPTTPVTYNDYKYGLNNLSPISYVNNIGVDIIKSKLLNAKVHYMVSALDNNPADTSMGKSAE